MEFFILIGIVVVIVIVVNKNKMNTKKATSEVTIKMTGRSFSETSEEYERANELIIKATSLKKEDMQAAINKIEEALSICPDLHGGHRKLVKYLIVANQIDKAKNVVSQQKSKFQKNSFKHSDVTGRSEWLSLGFDCEKNDTNAEILSNLYGVYFELLNSAINGETKDISLAVNEFKAQNFSRAFLKALKQKENENLIVSKFGQWLTESKPFFTKMSGIYNRTDIYKLMEKDAMKGINTDGDYEHRVLLKSKAYCAAYNNVNETVFENFLNENIQPLL